MQSTYTGDPEALRSIYLFSAFDEQQLAAVARTTRVVQIQAGDRLFDFAQPVEYFFYVKIGQIKLFRSSNEGGEKVISIVRPNQTFAEAVMFMDEPTGYPVSADAIVASELLAFSRHTTRELLAASIDACFSVMANMSRRLRGLVDQIDELSLHNATYRLVSYLLQQVPADVVESPDVQLTTPKHVIASHLSIQPETLSRILARLSSGGLVEVHRSHIILRDIAGLRDLILL